MAQKMIIRQSGLYRVTEATLPGTIEKGYFVHSPNIEERRSFGSDRAAALAYFEQISGAG